MQETQLILEIASLLMEYSGNLRGRQLVLFEISDIFTFSRR